MTETTSTTSETETVETAQYFYYIHAKYSRKLPRPEVEITEFPGGYAKREREYEEAEGFIAGVITLPGVVGKFDILKHAMKASLDAMNKSRTDQGLALLFGPEHQRVTAFDGGRNAL